MRPGTKLALDYSNYQHQAKNRHFSDLEFFNRIGRFQRFAPASVLVLPRVVSGDCRQSEVQFCYQANSGTYSVPIFSRD